LTVTVPAEYAEIGALTWRTLEPSWTVHAFVDVVEVTSRQQMCLESDEANVS
jgi:hypothetical protein